MAKNRMEELLSRPLRTADELHAAEAGEQSGGVPWAEPSEQEGQTPNPTPLRESEDRLYRFPEPPAAITPILSTNNREKLERAKAHIEKLFLLAAAGLIEGVHFYGKTSIEVSWQDGSAQQISTSISAKDQMLQ
jgi:hypothetical protein